ncbi:hypothetical protein D6T64_18380, partial [Cryobacterium melibiosiphilum]
MSSEALGGGVMILVAAVLWVAYLMPTWTRRKQYLATERNAVRLQQTLRVLAETAEVPRHVHLEANARTVADQQKLLAQVEAEERRDAKAALDAAAEVRRAAAALAAAARPPVVVTPAQALRRLRRARALSSSVLLLGLLATIAGLAVVAVTGAWLLLGVGAVAVFASVNTLARLNRVARAKRMITVDSVEWVEARTRPTMAPFEPVQLEATPVEPVTWTPQSLPRPMHLSRGSIAQAAMASVEAANQLRQASVDAERERRSAPLVAAAAATRAPAAPVTPISRPPARPAAS